MDFLTEEFIYKKSSQEITSLLYEALIDNLYNSIDDINGKQYFDANKKLQKVNDILYRLGAGLNYEAGIIADQLDHLYNYMANRVIEGNKKKDAAIIQEVISMAERISGSWNEALKNKPAQNQTQFRQKANAYERNVMIAARQMNTVEEGK